MIEEQLKAELFLYPCTYDELFCISCAEAQVAGVYPITSVIGALKTTNMGTQIYGNPGDSSFSHEFIDEVQVLSNSSELSLRRIKLQEEAITRFDPERIADIWDKEVFNI